MSLGKKNPYFVQINRKFCLDVIIQTGHELSGDAELFFGEDAEHVVFRPEGTTMIDLLVELGAFSSKSQARKAGWKPEPPPDGFSMTTIGKVDRQLTVLNPQPEVEPDA